MEEQRIRTFPESPTTGIFSKVSPVQMGGVPPGTKPLPKGLLMVVSKRWSSSPREQIPLPPSNLYLTPFLPQFHLFLNSFLPFLNLNLTSASSGISNHGLETTVYRPLEYMQERILGELIFARIHAGPVFALARIQENIFEELLS